MKDFKTTDLYDEHLESLQVAVSIFRDFGGKTRFCGKVVTLKAVDDNSFLRQSFAENGTGKVLVVDASASMRCAMMGDMMADLAASNGWEGVIINGCIRDSADVAKVQLGVKALATTPRKTAKNQQGLLNIPVHFAGVTFTPDAYVYADEDGIVIANENIL
ncbi:MAG TPA: RraA family protein [Ghiorsea sp.]|nr:RraA family protein [Ghiorsea sp.]HIP06579.1 RraA family protein [Mariprofundaceae bacterium]